MTMDGSRLPEALRRAFPTNRGATGSKDRCPFEVSGQAGQRLQLSKSTGGTHTLNAAFKPQKGHATMSHFPLANSPGTACQHAPHFKSPSTRDTHLTLPPRSKPAVTEEQTQRHCHDIQAHESPQHWRSQLTKYLLIVIDSGTEAEGSRLLRGLPGPGGLASTLGKGR